MPAIDLTDVQGNVLRGYNMDFARIFLLRVDNATAARKFIRESVQGDPLEGLRITSAATWDVKPGFAFNIGLTARGLEALGIPQDVLRSFPLEFRVSPAERASLLGDLGEGAPENWVGGLACSPERPSDTHIVAMLHVSESSMLEPLTALARSRFTDNGGCFELNHVDGATLPNRRVHFGYVDGIAQPQLEGIGVVDNDGEPPVPAGEFLLGYPGLNGASYPIPTPEWVGINGTFLALRILKQDVDGFERFLEDSASQVRVPAGVDGKEFIAAKLCGRWRNGLPLSLSPETDQPNPPVPDDEWNRFDYTPSERYPNAIPDAKGSRCPLGSHIRRSNPRSGVVAGGGGHNHRLIRRGIPYGPPYDPANPNDGRERGLIGMFYCGSLSNQFEFLTTEWINKDSFGLRGDLDPISGNNDATSSRFVIVESENPLKVTRLTGFNQFVVTRGSAYAFMPGLTALNKLATL